MAPLKVYPQQKKLKKVPKLIEETQLIHYRVINKLGILKCVRFFNITHRRETIFTIFEINDTLFRINRFNVMSIHYKAVMTSKETFIKLS